LLNHTYCAWLLIDVGADKDAKDRVRVGHRFAVAFSLVPPFEIIFIVVIF
jgi:hypothetical protein